MRVLLVGASGGCGRHLLRDLLSRDGVSVTALVRSAGSLPDLNGDATARLKTIVITGLEALNEEWLLGHLQECNFDAICCCLGHHAPGADGMTFKGVYGPENQRTLCTDFSQKVCSVVRSLKPAKPIKYIVISSPGAGLRPADPPRSFGERFVLGLLLKMAPPHADNVANADFLLTQMPGGESVNPFLEICLLRPDVMVNITEKESTSTAAPEAKDSSTGSAAAAASTAVVGEYTVHETLQYGLFNAGVTSRENVGRFMADLVTESALWEIWKGKSPQVLDAFQPGKASTEKGCICQ